MAKETAPAPSGWMRVLHAVRIIHPFPTLANVVAVGLFAVVAMRGWPPWSRMLPLLATMFLIQSAIGAANDAFDADLDRLSKPWKPIVAGSLSRVSAGCIAVTAAVAACVLAATFGVQAWLAAMGGLACGLAYDAGLKRTAYSVVTYLLALPLLPVWVWAALGKLKPELLWEYPLGILIGAALYLGNTAPDVVSDAAAGVDGMAHRMGTRGALVGGWCCLGLALLLGPLIALFAGYDARRVLATSAGALVLLAIAAGYSRFRPEPAGLRIGWGIMVASSLLFAVGWLAAAP